MPGVAQIIFTAEELHALVKASTNKGTTLSPRMEAAILPKLEEARNLLGCPVPFAREPGELDTSQLHQCPACNKTFQTFIDLYDHLKTHSRQKEEDT